MFALWEINQMELEMFSYLEWQLNVEPSTLRNFNIMFNKILPDPDLIRPWYSLSWRRHRSPTRVRVTQAPVPALQCPCSPLALLCPRMPQSSPARLTLILFRAVRHCRIVYGSHYRELRILSHGFTVRVERALNVEPGIRSRDPKHFRTVVPFPRKMSRPKKGDRPVVW